MKQLLFGIALLGSIAIAGDGQADIYRFDGEDDVVSFSDAPLDRRYQLVMKEQQSRSTKSGSSRQPAGPKKPAAVSPRAAEQSGSLPRILPIQGIITSQTGLRSDPFDGKLKHHNGLDIAAPSGTPVKPVAPGVVIFSGWKGGYGNTVILDHSNGLVTVYAHHSRNLISEGSTVDMDTVIALTGSTGRSTGPHLHFEAWQNDANITADFMPTNMSAHQATPAVNASIRRLLQADGTILFTNLR